MKKIEEIKKKVEDLKMTIAYLRTFLLTCYKGSDAKEKVERELIPLQRELKILEWVIDDELPF